MRYDANQVGLIEHAPHTQFFYRLLRKNLGEMPGSNLKKGRNNLTLQKYMISGSVGAPLFYLFHNNPPALYNFVLCNILHQKAQYAEALKKF